jgi:hypothetical protein
MDHRPEKNILEEYDLSKKDSLGWYKVRLLKKHIIEDKWYTEEYEVIKNNPALLDMYNFTQDLNSLAKEVGYHSSNFKFSKRFLPWVRKDLNPLEFLRDMATVHDEEKEYYGKLDPDTNRLEKHVPRPFINPLETGYSTDIGKESLSLYAGSDELPYHSEIEGDVEMIQTMEKAKQHFVVGEDGYLRKNEHGELLEEDGNDQNERLLQQQVDALLYFRQYAAESGLGSPEVNKVIEGLNKYTQLKVFTLNMFTPLVNGVGGAIQATTNSGRFWKKGEWWSQVMKIGVNAFRGREGNIEKGLLDFFMLMTENPNRHKIKQMTSSRLHKRTIQEIFMTLMRVSDILIQEATALCMLKNSAFIDGKIENVRDYIRRQDQVKYKDLSLRKGLEKTFNQRVETFIKDDPRMLHKLASFNKEGVLEVAGVDRNSEEFADFRRRVQNEIKKIVGASTEDEKKVAERNILVKSMMMFKGWIEPLMQVRFSNLHIAGRTDEYEMGRTRIWWQLLTNGFGEGRKESSIFNGLKRSITDLKDIWVCNTHGLSLLEAYYKRTAEEYKRKTGQELTMTPEDFYDMTRDALRQQAKDVLALLSLVTVYFIAASAEPPDDPEKKNLYNSMLRLLNKMHDEVSFYYNPLSFQQIANGSLLPSVGVLTDGLRIVRNSGREIFGDEDTQNKTHTAKSILRTIPILNQGTATILPLVDPETAKEMGFRVNPQNPITR